MKYLNKREEFLSKQKVTLIKENEAGAGPFANDLGWHDTLLGRLIDHSIRKAKIRYNIKRMKPLIERLESEFDRINAEGAATQLSKEDWVKMVKLKLFSFYDNLKTAVDNKEELEVIKSLTDEAIEQTQSIEGSHEDFEIKETLLKELKLFKEFLENYKEPEKITDEQLDEMMVSNLEILLKIMKNPWVRDFKKEKVEKTKEKFDKNSIKVGGYYLRSDKEGKPHLIKVVADDVTSKGEIEKGYVSAVYFIPQKNEWRPMTTGVSKDKIFKEVRVNGDKLSQEDTKIVSKVPVKTTELVTKSNDKRFDESLLIESNEVVELSKDVKNKLRSSIILLTKNDKEFSITKDTLEKLISEFKNNSEDAKYIVRNLYKEIFSCLKGRRKGTVADPDPLVKESYDLLISQKDVKIPIMGELIAKFAKRSKQFEEGQLYKKLGEIGELTHKFNESLNQIIDNNIGEPDYSSKKEEVKESLMMYEKFISYIKEADETQTSDREVSDIEETNKIKDFFDKNCKTVRNYVMEKTEAEKIGKNLEELEKDMKEGDSFIIDGMDPVIEICRLFNRAFKIYITRNQRAISKRTERTGGGGLKYSSAFLEYTDLGSSGGGPWRNNKLFDMWEEAVYKILGDRKYQHIFSKNTKIRIPKVPDPRRPEDYEFREQAGANLRKMITDLLDGDDLYKIGKDKGKQNEFLSKYFGEPDDKTSEKTLSVGKDGEENLEIEKDIKPIELSFSKPSKINIGIGSSFAIKGTSKAEKEGDIPKNVKRCFLVVGTDPKYIYLMVSNSFGDFKGYLDKFGSIKIDYDFISKSMSNDISYTRIEKELLPKLEGGKLKITSTKKGSKEQSSETIIVKNSLFLLKKDGELFTVDGEKLKEVIKSKGEEIDVESLISSKPSSDNIKITKL
jgi:hypothetical protein